MSIDHAAEAAHLLSQASFRKGDGPDAPFADPQTAAVLATLAQAHATLAHLPEQLVDAQARAKAAEERLEKALAAASRCAWEMSIHRDQAVRNWAIDLTHWLDEAGVNIDDRVDALSEMHGRGPSLFDVFGVRYALSRQHIDAHGKRWEHTGSWTDEETPVMRRDEPDGDAMTLPDLIRERGPLSVLARPAAAPAQEVEAPF